MISICKKIAKRYAKLLIANFTFHNVGQGLFYTGEVGNLNFVYDCGSEQRNVSNLHSAIRNYKSHKLLSRAKIDLLILSHLHDDHVIGLNVLLNERVSVDTAILPYLLPIERLMIALRGDDLPSWFYDFLADPVSFLIERGVERIVLLGGREAISPEYISTNEESFGDEQGINLDEMLDDEYLRNEVLENDGQLKKFLFRRRLLIKNHKRSLRAKGMWFFRFFNCKVKDSNLDLFEKRIKKIIKSDDLLSVIRNKSKRHRLRYCFKALHGDFNNTSLVVYHGPIFSHRLELLQQGSGYLIDTCPPCFFVPHKHTIHQPETAGHLLTGDVDLNQKWAEIERHYDNYLAKAFSALVPHHGAKKNWNGTILTKTPRKCAWVASFGIANTYGHPCVELIQDIIRNGNILYWCNEFNKISAYCILGYQSH